ncbi:CCA tRNA nucleotidyltransferase, partial [Thioclava sp. BHET1]
PAEGFDAEALAACAAGAEGIERLSRERIGAEMRKLLAAPDPGAAVAVMAQSGILRRVLPGADAKALPILLYLEGDLPADWPRRLATLGGADVADHLRLSRDEARRQTLIREGIGGGGPAELGYRHGAALARDILLVRGALLETDLPPGWQMQVEAGAVAEFPVRARDLMPAYSGAALGRKLAELEARWIASGFSLGREDLLA